MVGIELLLQLYKFRAATQTPVATANLCRKRRVAAEELRNVGISIAWVLTEQ
jgi:hypothetical protein